MIRQLLDIISSYPGDHHPRRLRDLKESIGEPEEVVRDTVECVKDSLSDSISVDSVASANVVPGAGGDDASMLMWAVLVVLAVLAMCLYFVYSYRKHHLLHKASMG